MVVITITNVVSKMYARCMDERGSATGKKMPF
jgi:hypothetical protein